MSTNATVQQIFTYFIKGLTPHACDRVDLLAEHGIPGDRAFALTYADQVPNDSKTYPWQRKHHFAMQHDWAGLASLDCHYEVTTRQLSVKRQGISLLSEDTANPEGRDRISAFFTGYLAALKPSENARHPEPGTLQLVGNGQQTRYPDRNVVHISLVSQATLDNLSELMGKRVDARRFRPNFVVDGVAAWEELTWVGKEFTLGTARILVTAPINRCLNIDVNPESGEHDLSLFKFLPQHFGHCQTGVVATVLTNGTVGIGDRLQMSQ